MGWRWSYKPAQNSLAWQQDRESCTFPEFAEEFWQPFYKANKVTTDTQGYIYTLMKELERRRLFDV